MPVKVVLDDITQMHVDAIVNTCNKYLRSNNGVCGAIHKAAGTKLLAECLSLGTCEVGEAKITNGYNLPSKYVIHTVSPVWQDGLHGELALLRSCYWSSLELAVQHECHSIAFPSIGTGAHGYPKEQAMQIAADTINAFLHQQGAKYNLEVYLVTYSEESYKVAEKYMAGLKQKTILCPKHKIPMTVSNQTLEFAGSQFSVCVGECIKCATRYMGQQIMSCAKVTVNGYMYEYYAGLPAHATEAQKSVNTNSPAPNAAKQSDQIADIERYFMAAEKEMLEQEKLNNLTAENAALQEQVKELKKKLSEQEKQHHDLLKTFRAKQKEQLNLAVRSLETKHKKELEDTVAEYKSRIARLNKLHTDAMDEAQRAVQKELETAQRRVSMLLQSNGELSQKVAILTQQLAEAKGPARQVVFVDEKLYVCGGTIRCEKYNHHREDVTGIIDTISGKPITMTVCHCKDCKLYYVKDAVFDSYRAQHGTLLGQFIRKADGMTLGQMAGYGELAPESILHMNGYNVSQANNLTSLERRKILMYIMESRIMDKHDIRNRLTYLIKMNQHSPTKQEAVSRWSADIRWVNDYRSGMQDLVWLSGTAMYKYWRKR